MKRRYLCFITLALLCMCGCKKEAVLTSTVDTLFETEINTICEEIASLHKEMNSIHPSDSQALSDMLLQLDKMEEEFLNFAALEFPEEYEYLRPYAVEAKDYMSEAVRVYEEIYSVDSYDSSKDEYARENYKRAFKRFNAVLAVLRGEDPNKQ